MKKNDIVVVTPMYGSIFLINDFKEEYLNYSEEDFNLALSYIAERERLFGKNNFYPIINNKYRKYKGVILSEVNFYVLVKWENNHYSLVLKDCLEVLTPFVEKTNTESTTVEESTITPFEL